MKHWNCADHKSIGILILDWEEVNNCADQEEDGDDGSADSRSSVRLPPPYHRHLNPCSIGEFGLEGIWCGRNGRGSCAKVFLRETFQDEDGSRYLALI
ncbi:hypothetical protein Ddc_11570 [Ditylenchus destructor]|nr:hypothetical protein Ddc_11570 [Ditylenchus destructor]